MEISDIKKKTDLASGLVALIGVVIAVIYLITPKATMLFGIAAIIASSIGVGFSLGTGYADRLLKKDKKENKIEEK